MSRGLLNGIGLCEDWLWLDERIDGTTNEIEQISKREGNCQRLMTIPGIGLMISTAIVAAIDTGEAFDRSRDFGAWLGLVPRQFSTEGKPILGRISKRGSNYLKTLFVQAAHRSPSTVSREVPGNGGYNLYQETLAREKP